MDQTWRLASMYETGQFACTKDLTSDRVSSDYAEAISVHF
jgi:hypothetical protein